MSAADVLALPRTKRPGWIYVAKALILEYPHTVRRRWAWGGEYDGRDLARCVESTGWKVGRTTNLPQRVTDLLGSCRDMTFVAVSPGSSDDEFAIHRTLRGQVIPSGYGGLGEDAREWYRDTSEFRAWLSGFDAVWRGSIRCATQDRGGARSEYMPRVRGLWAALNGPRTSNAMVQLPLFGGAP